jgi:hypothetical protein
MKPHRVRMAHDLLLKYDVINQLEVRLPRSRRARRRDSEVSVGSPLVCQQHTAFYALRGLAARLQTRVCV